MLGLQLRSSPHAPERQRWSLAELTNTAFAFQSETQLRLPKKSCGIPTSISGNSPTANSTGGSAYLLDTNVSMDGVSYASKYA